MSTSSPFHATERGTWRRAAATAAGSSWRSMRWRVASRAISRQRSGRPSGCATSTNASTPPRSSSEAIRSQESRSTSPVRA